MNREVSAFELTKPRAHSLSHGLEYQALGACFKPYRAIGNLQKMWRLRMNICNSPPNINGIFHMAALDNQAVAAQVGKKQLKLSKGDSCPWLI
jgi:hypothetical protein